MPCPGVSRNSFVHIAYPHAGKQAPANVLVNPVCSSSAPSQSLRATPRHAKLRGRITSGASASETVPPLDPLTSPQTTSQAAREIEKGNGVLEGGSSQRPHTAFDKGQRFLPGEVMEINTVKYPLEGLRSQEVRTE